MHWGHFTLPLNKISNVDAGVLRHPLNIMVKEENLARVKNGEWMVNDWITNANTHHY